MTEDRPRSAGMIRPVVSATPRPLIGPDKVSPRAFHARVLTLFPEMFPGPLGGSLTGRALSDRLWAIEALDIRRFSRDKHRTVDDTPAGGGPGMVMRADVVAAALDAAAVGTPGDRGRWPVLYLSPRGRVFDQAMARRLAGAEGITLLCGRFEGVDQRVLDAREVEEVSIGDYVLTGGELAAMVLLDAVLRLRPGVIGNAESTLDESHARGLLEHPQFTRPALWEGHAIPEVLLSGNHARIAAWRSEQSATLTQERRPDLWRAHAAPAGEAELSDAHTTAGKGGPDKDQDR